MNSIKQFFGHSASSSVLHLNKSVPELFCLFSEEFHIYLQNLKSKKTYYRFQHACWVNLRKQLILLLQVTSKKNLTTKEYIGLMKIQQTTTPNVKSNKSIFCYETSFYHHKLNRWISWSPQLFLHTVYILLSWKKLLFKIPMFIQTRLPLMSLLVNLIYSSIILFFLTNIIV